MGLLWWLCNFTNVVRNNYKKIQNKTNSPHECHSGSSDLAFFKGGSLSASSFKAVSFSVCLRLVPGSGERDNDFLISDFSNDEVGCFGCGGVDRPSGVPDRLRCAISVRKRAARLLGELTASA
jgi:hypothetical protein